ncbi:MAG: serine hydrolase [Brevefilum sp.]
MKQKHRFPLFRWTAIVISFITLILATLQLVEYSRLRNNFPVGMQVGGVPIGGLDYVQAAERLYTVYRSPIELVYAGNTIHIRPAVLGFEPAVERMLAVADNQRVTEPFWEGYWNFLWSRELRTVDIPLTASYDESRIEDYLRTEISARYDAPATPPKPVPGTSQFAEGISGTSVDIDRATLQVIDALKSPTNRRVTLALDQTFIPRPSLNDLEIMIRQIIEVSGFDGMVEVYMQDLGSTRNISLAHQGNGQEFPPNIAFSSWSLVKIPLMVTAFRYMEEPYPPEAIALMEEMIQQSENTSTDQLAMMVIDNNLSPLIVTEDMQQLGLENTFWAGHFYVGAPLLQNFTTTANQRTDIDTRPDRYNQTTAADMGMLLEDIYMCAENGGGSLIAAFPGEITQEKCRLMIDIMELNKIGVLIQAGVPSGTTVAHKHGWAIETDGLVHTYGNAALVYSPGGNYVLTIFAHHPVQAVFDPVNILFANISSAIYNFFNN